jgi:hypothetical protein
MDNKTLKDLALSDIAPNPHNPRIIFDEKDLDDLKDSIRNAGVLVPITVYENNEPNSPDKYILLDGERRWRCAKVLGLPTIPANIVDKPKDVTQNILYMFNIHYFRKQWELFPTALKLEKIIELLKGDCETINAADNSFDAVTVAFGVRNFQNLEKGLKEILRVLKPGGKLVVLEFSQPKTAVVKQFYKVYMNVVAPGMGKLFSKNRNAYKYLDESIKKFPEGKNFTIILDNLGYINTYCKPLSFGICSIYCGEK